MDALKTILTLSVLVCTTFVYRLSAQEICMVTADLQTAEKYVVIWDKPLNPLYDSVYIYRKVDGETVYTKIGATSISNDFSYFSDETSNTMEETYYKISFLDALGVETPLSPFHKPLVLDYQYGAYSGTLTWTPYLNEADISQDWILNYTIYRDYTGMGNYEMFTYFPNGQMPTEIILYDTTYIAYPVTYYIDVLVPTCSITKSNINTSRSNIKHQFPNAEAGIDKKESVIFYLMPNPTTDFVSVFVEEQFLNDEYVVHDQQGKIISKGTIHSKLFEIDLSKETSGTYFLTLRHGTKMMSKTILKN